MAIDAMDSPFSIRKGVACYGSVLPAEARVAFTEREFMVHEASCTDEDLSNPEFLAGVSVIVFIQNKSKLLSIVKPLEAHAKRLLDWDCRVVVISPPVGNKIVANLADKLHMPVAGLNSDEEKLLDSWQQVGQGLPPLPHISVYSDSVPWKNISNFCLTHLTGPSPQASVKIDIQGSLKLSEGETILLRRAFWNCESIFLKKMSDGLSKISVYRLYAELANGHLGKWPHSYFIKIGDRTEVFNEYKVYQESVIPYIPFHLGPHLIADRCYLGFNEGIIVGNFVEESESLLDCARDGRAAHAIACLFDQTLRGWYRAAVAETSNGTGVPALNSAKDFVDGIVGKLVMPSARYSIATRLGAKLTFERMLSILADAPLGAMLVGPIHGDLHAKNVCVRGYDSIAIDFLKHCKGPLLYDAACLEASFLIDGFVKNGGEGGAELAKTTSEWLEAISPLYEFASEEKGAIHPDPRSKWYWYYCCIGQLRRYAMQKETSPDQYAFILSIALLKKAAKNLKFEEFEEYGRAAAYVLASSLLEKLTGRTNGSKVSLVNSL